MNVKVEAIDKRTKMLTTSIDKIQEMKLEIKNWQLITTKGVFICQLILLDFE
jgi:hypothetical protein